MRSPGSHSSNAGAIAGGVAGGIAGLALVLGIAGFFLFRRRQRGKTDPEAVNTVNTYTPKNYFDSDLQVYMLPLQLHFVLLFRAV